MAKIIGILGFKGSGKDTAGEYLVREHGYQIESFANPLKDMVAAVFGWDRDLLEGNTTDSRTWRETPDTWWEAKLCWETNKGSYLGRFTPRIALQYLGTDVLRSHFDDGIWIKSLESRLRDHDRVVVTDCRFPNECQLIRGASGLLMRVRRGSEPQWFDTARSAALGDEEARLGMVSLYPHVHISEWAWLNQDYHLVENNGSLQDLYGRTECLVNNHFKTS